MARRGRRIALFSGLGRIVPFRGPSPSRLAERDTRASIACRILAETGTNDAILQNLKDKAEDTRAYSH